MNTSISPTHLQAFARDLFEARQRMGWSQSDLARKVWGETTDGRGYKVARNRDLISVYEKGKAAPTHDNLTKLAKVLGTTADALAPGLLSERNHPSVPPAVQMTVIEGQPDRVRLQINTTIPFELASKIMTLLSQSGAFTSNAPAPNATVAPSNEAPDAG